MLLIKRAALFALPVFFISTFSLAHAASVVAVQQQAEDLRLSEKAHWHKLLHYRELGDGYASFAGGPRLFISPDGANNPQAELAATIAALLNNDYLEQREEYALCAFPARLRWLMSELSLSARDFPAQDCPQREAWRKELNPTSATLVFPDAYISSPGSMFGHTLLRVNGATSGARAGLLAYAVNYAADVRGVGAVEYAVKGLTGGFPGFFGLFPYYTKVKEYAWIEHRDLWEYPLNLNDEELARMLEHLWELKLVPFKYFFFNRNCSWQLLALLEIARPGLDLTEGMDLYAIPVDTVRRLQDEGLVVGEPVLRPSRQRELDHARKTLSKMGRHSVIELVEGRMNVEDTALRALSRAEQIVVLDAAYELVHVRFRRGDYERKVALPRAHALLRERSRLGADKSGEIDYEVTSPDKAHDSARWGLSAGNAAFGDWVGFSIRPAFHDLLDPDPGFLPGYGIDFGRLSVRYYKQTESLRLESFTVLAATSRNAWTRWNKPGSWRLNIAVTSPEWVRAFDADPRLGANVVGEWGAALGGARSHVFLGAAIASHWGRSLDKNGRIALAPVLAAKWSIAERLSATADLRWNYSVAGTDVNDRVANVGIQWQLSNHSALRFTGAWREAKWNDSSEQFSRDVGLSWLRYF